MTERYKDTTVVIASSEDESVFDCIDSVHNDAKVVVSLTPSHTIESRLTKAKIPHVVVPRGNLGLTFNSGINLAETNKVIIMTDDATFDPDAIGKLSEALEEFDACKARIIFHYDRTKPLTKLVANARDFINSIPTHAFTPGLAINKDIKDRMGGHFFDEQVRWAEDAEFSYRLKRGNLSFGYIQDATINHPPVSLKHDLRGAFLIGLSKRRSVDLGLREGDEDIMPTFRRVLSGETFQRKIEAFRQKGTGTAAYMTLWDIFYNLGYNLRRMGLSEKIEENLWGSFGKSARNIRNIN